MWASLVYFRLLLTKLWGIMCFSLVSMLDFMGQNLTPLKSRLSKLQSWHQNFLCLVGPNEHFYTRCLLSARTSHGTTFAPRLYRLIPLRASNKTNERKSKTLQGTNAAHKSLRQVRFSLGWEPGDEVLGNKSVFSYTNIKNPLKISSCNM